MLLVFSCLQNCINYSNISDKHDILVDFQSNNRHIKLLNLVIRRGNVSQKNKFFNLTFESVRGGGQRFLGYSYKHAHGDTYKGRLSVMCSDENKVKISIEEILNWKTTTVDNDPILIAPALCNTPE